MPGIKLLSALTALMLLLAGCQAPPEPVSFPQEEPLVSGQMVIVDRSSRGEPSSWVEWPPIDAENPLSAEEPEDSESPPEPESSVEAPPSSSQAPVSSSSSEESPPSSSQASVPSSSSPEAPPSSSQASVPTSSSETPPSSVPSSGPIARPATVSAQNEVRAVWVSYLELSPMLLGKTESQFTKSVREMFDNCADFGLNTAFVHVRPFGDALYDSDYFPWSYLITGTEGVDPGFDPLEIMIREGHARGLRIEAWLNPYRVRHDPKYALCADNQAKKWLDEGASHVASNGKGNIVYNPGSGKARDLIVAGVREIVRNYDVDGIHIDDYFYPTTLTDWDKTFDTASYNAYKSAGGALAHADWRRQNVDTLVRAIYAAVKQENPRVAFGVSPQSSVYNNYNAMYFDVEKALSTPGYCDYICPQIYFGYQNDAQPYAQTLAAWDNMIKAPGVRLYAGLAVYKAGLADSWAGSGKSEWQNNNDLLERQVLSARNAANYGGFALYRYDSIFNPASGVKSHIARECSNLQDIL